MTPPRIRIGIDVGGTFTHAIALEAETLQLLGHAVVPTTHRAETGVAEGIISALLLLFKNYHIAPEQIVFIAHSTTQATNALLEGDVAKIGVLGMGAGLAGLRAKSETQINKIALAPGRYLQTFHRFVDTSQDSDERARIEELRSNLAHIECSINPSQIPPLRGVRGVFSSMAASLKFFSLRFKFLQAAAPITNDRSEDNTPPAPLKGGISTSFFSRHMTSALPRSSQQENVDKDDSLHQTTREALAAALTELRAEGAEVMVASAAFSVEDSTQEQLALATARALNIPATAAHQISQLYGLHVRTRTAALNASMLPIMMRTANHTAAALQRLNITAPLLIMRSDGGVMNLAAMRERPILTMLSGPAAGVAAALLYARLSEGIFIEVGGTSSDLSAIRYGKPMLRSAQVGGHQLYIRTLDVRTLGVAGGSMVRMRDGKIIDVGPRSAHIAGLPYEAFADARQLEHAHIELLAPCAGDPKDYVVLVGKTGQRFAFTATGAANVLGLIPEHDHAFGNREAAARAYAILEGEIKISAHEIAEQILACAAMKLRKEIENLIEDYELERAAVTLLGGGGGANVLVPFVAQQMNLKFSIAENHAVLSAIGAALAMVQDSIERSLINPTEADLIKLRHEAEESVRRMGAAPASIEVQIEIDAQQNRVYALASGTTELRQRNPVMREMAATLRREIARQALHAKENALRKLATTEHYEVFAAELEERKLLGLARIQHQGLCVIDREGIIRLKLQDGRAFLVEVANALPRLEIFLREHTRYGDGGERIPKIFVLAGSRILNFSTLHEARQVLALVEIELKRISEEAEVVLLGELG